MRLPTRKPWAHPSRTRPFGLVGFPPPAELARLSSRSAMVEREEDEVVSRARHSIGDGDGVGGGDGVEDGDDDAGHDAGRQKQAETTKQPPVSRRRNNKTL